jgi:hypothetical protein
MRNWGEPCAIDNIVLIITASGISAVIVSLPLYSIYLCGPFFEFGR